MNVELTEVAGLILTRALNLSHINNIENQQSLLAGHVVDFEVPTNHHPNRDGFILTGASVIKVGHSRLLKGYSIRFDTLLINKINEACRSNIASKLEAIEIYHMVISRISLESLRSMVSQQGQIDAMYVPCVI